MNNQDVIEKTNKYVMNTYARLPVAICRGKGVYLWDVEGKKYLDFLSGLGVNILGYFHPHMTYALTKQSKDLLHISNLVHISQQAELAEILVEHSFADKIFFCNSGAEANEAAVKLARKWGGRDSQGRYEILTADQSFHGRTLGMISASGQERLRRDFGPVAPGFRHIPFGDEKAAHEAVGPETCAIMVEPIQGEGGVVVPPQDYLKALKDICQEHHLLLILDEVQTGMGRTGRLFAYEHFGVVPDIATVAKGLGGGVPIGAVLAQEGVAGTFVPGDHASTFGGNPLATAVALAVLKVLTSEEILENCRTVGSYFLDRLGELNRIHNVRGYGLMIGCDVDHGANDIMNACLKAGLFINAIQNRILRFLPPLILKKKQVDEGMKILKEVLGSC